MIICEVCGTPFTQREPECMRPVSNCCCHACQIIKYKQDGAAISLYKRKRDKMNRLKRLLGY